MSPREELIEAMAKADQDRRPNGRPWCVLRPETRAPILRDMKRHLEAIEAHAGGCLVVPREPTAAICIAIDNADGERPDTDLSYNDNMIGAWGQSWRDAVAASIYAPEKTP